VAPYRRVGDVAAQQSKNGRHGTEEDALAAAVAAQLTLDLVQQSYRFPKCGNRIPNTRQMNLKTICAPNHYGKIQYMGILH